ncbi:MAG: ASCH domain-containing protein [Deltaproteobacteria bacterium]|nr:ASCH domain-containing protein [Deltaproteobacteria bacterium]
MSFMLTTEQARNKTKPVTRRLGWGFLKPGDIVQQVVKSQGLKKGQKVEKIHLIKIVSTRWEPLNLIVSDPVYGYKECALEGFPELTPDEFVKMFCDANRCKPYKLVNRIAFNYL